MGSGNNGNDSAHTAGKLKNRQKEEISFAVSSRESSLNIQIWKSYADETEITIIAPSGRNSALCLNRSVLRDIRREIQIFLFIMVSQALSR